MTRAAMLAVLALPALAGCSGQYTSPNSWDVRQANRINLAVSADQPFDLVRGRGVPGGEGFLAAGAIERLRSGQTRRLPTVTTSSQGGGGDSGGPAGGSAGSTGLGGGGGGGAPAGGP